MPAEMYLAYKVKLFPTRSKADTLANLAQLFHRLHAGFLHRLDTMAPPKQPSTAGQGEFAERAARCATVDYCSTKRSAAVTHRPFVLPYLKGEIIDAAEVFLPRRAHAFDLWVKIQGSSLPGTAKPLYLPAKKHKALNRTLALPGARMATNVIVLRKNGKWYARIGVRIPCPEPYEVKGWLGCDVGMRKSVVRSDGYEGPDLRPLVFHTRDKKARHQQQALKRSLGDLTPQRQLLAHEARQTVLVGLATGRGVAVEHPKRLARYKGHAARYFGYRCVLLGAMLGVPIALVDPRGTSLACSRCGAAQWLRYREMFRCWDCGFTHNSDHNASRNISHWASHSDRAPLPLPPQPAPWRGRRREGSRSLHAH